MENEAGIGWFPFTLDGSEPREGTVYTGPIPLEDKGARMQVFAHAEGLEVKREFTFPAKSEKGVKAMVETLASHPVGMSKAQFEKALTEKSNFWLYIVENATSEEPRILKIQDPAGNARTFTFDEGWREIAMVSQVNVETGEVKI